MAFYGLTGISVNPHPQRQRRYHRRSRNGCVTCKRRHVKCDEARPVWSRHGETIPAHESLAPWPSSSSETSERDLEADGQGRQSASCVRSGSGCLYHDESTSTGEQSDSRDGDLRHNKDGMRCQSRARDISEPLSSSEEAEGCPGLRADTFTTTLFSGASTDLSEKTWWLFSMLARERRTDFRPSPTGASFQLPVPPWSSPDVNVTPKTPGHIQVPLLHFKQDAFNFIKRNLGSPSKETGDSVMATISCLMLLETASLEANPDAHSAVVMHLNGLVTAANHYCGPLVTAELTLLQKFLGMAISCVTRNDVQEQVLSTVSNVDRCSLRCVLFIGLSPKPADAWWCVDENKAANSDGGSASLLRRIRGQQGDAGFASARMIAYIYLSLVLRPGRMSNEILMCLVDTVGTDTEGLVQRGINDLAEQAISFWNVMLSGAAMASLAPLPGRGPEMLGRKQRMVERSIRDTSAMLHLQTWPEAVNMLKRVAYVGFEGEQELKSMWEKAVSDVDQCA